MKLLSLLPALYLCFIINFLGGTFVYAGEENLTQGLRFDGDMMSASLNQAPITNVLEEIKKKKGIWIKGAETVNEEKVSAHFKDLSLQKGLERIFSSLNYSFAFDHGGKLVGVFLMGRTSSERKPSYLRRPVPRRPSRRRKPYSPPKPPSHLK